MTYEELQEIERSVSGRRGMNGALIDMGMSKGQAARICGAYRWLKEHGAEEFERVYAERGNAEAMEVLGISKDTMYGIVAILGGKYKKRGDVDREWLYREYIEKNRSMGEIAEEIGADRDFIGRQTRKYGIKKDKAARYRGSIEKGKRTSEERGVYKRAREKRERTMLMRYGVDNAMASREIREKAYGESIGVTGDVERLRTVIEGLSDAERTYENIGRIIGVGRETVRRAVLAYGYEEMMPQDRHDSAIEHELTEWVKSIAQGERVEENVRIDGKEIDVYLPDRKIGIELNGAYWHSTKVNNDKYNIAHKQRKLWEQGIFVIEVWDTEWREKQEIVKDYISAKLGKITQRIAARKCTVEEISDKEKSEFLERYHILGNSRDEVAYGLKTKDGELVAVAAFGRNYRTAADVDMHLNRWCTKADTIVQGGFSKVFGYVTEKHKEWNTIVTHTDLRWSKRDDNVHMNNGFKCEGYLSPSPMVYRNGRLLNSLALKKSRIKKAYPAADVDKPTKELVDELGIIVVYDAGKTRNVWRRNNGR